jgi:glutamate--cysteine ligase
MLDVPMYFVFRDGKYIDAAGQSFRDFLDGKLPALPGEKPRKSDWVDHLSTAFPEVRLKSFLEMRGADGGPWSRICALPAFWVGLLYDQGALDAAWDLVKDWSMEGREALRASVPKLGLDAPLPGGGTLRDIAPRVLDIARPAWPRADAQRRRRQRDRLSPRSTKSSPRGKTPAERLLDLYNGPGAAICRRSTPPRAFERKHLR